jgi:hypothetical protein
MLNYKTEGLLCVGSKPFIHSIKYPCKFKSEIKCANQDQDTAVHECTIATLVHYIQTLTRIVLA